jgi:small-conductance mechanosensitive channel
MKFQIGDKVREGSHVGTVTDVGTVLIQVKTSDGTSRVVCPWELLPMRASHDGIGSHPAPE